MYIQMILTDYIDLYFVHCKLYFMQLYQSLLLGSQNLIMQQEPQEKRSTKYTVEHFNSWFVSLQIFVVRIFRGFSYTVYIVW